MLVKSFLMAKNRDWYALLLPKLSVYVLSYAHNRLLTCGHNDTRRVSLHPISEVRNSVASRMQRVQSVDETAMARNRYNRIPHPAQNTKWERDTYN